jgi:hydrogenase maturation protease
VRVIVAGVGYRNLRDHSIGVEVADRLEKASWVDDIVVEDLSYNPIAVVQRLEDEPPEQRFQRAIVVAAVERGGRAPGTVAAYRWDGVLPADEEIQRAVTEAVTGVIALDNTLVVTRHFGALPDDVVVVEVEPAVQEFGDTFSEVVGRQLDRICEMVRIFATRADAVEQLPRAPLGGLAPVGSRAT